MKKWLKRIGLITVLAVIPVLAGANACEKKIDDIMRVLGSTPGTFYNYGADGQVVFQAHCRSMHFERDTAYDVKNEEGKTIEPSSVIRVSCGDNLVSTVGFTSVYISDGAEDNLFANSQAFYNVRIENNDRGIPLINYVWRDFRDLFVGTARVASVSDQNNNPILAFASDHVTGYATDVAKSTMFKLNNDGEDAARDGYVWISRGSYTVIDTALLDGASSF